MRKISILFFMLLLPAILTISGFTKIKTNGAIEPPAEFQTLVNYLETNRGFINSDAAPALIPADEVRKNIKNQKYLVIDIRSSSWFEYGHIKGAVNVQPAELLQYFENSIEPSAYDKIVLTCYSGQSASYFSSLLRIAGYDNVYNMNFGMSSWRLDFAENSWLKNTSDSNISNLETAIHEKTPSGEEPVIETGKSEAEEILRSRLEQAFATPYKNYIVKASDVFEHPEEYYIIDYEKEERYLKGHIPNAIQYEPGESLSTSKDLLTLPAEKTIVLYGPTGQETAYAVAYLNILGYKTGNLAYGANSFMHKTLKDNNWEAFTKKVVNMYPVIE